MILGSNCEAKIARDSAAAAPVPLWQKRVCRASKLLKTNDTFRNNVLKPMIPNVVEGFDTGGGGWVLTRAIAYVAWYILEPLA